MQSSMSALDSAASFEYSLSRYSVLHKGSVGALHQHNLHQGVLGLIQTVALSSHAMALRRLGRPTDTE